MAPSPQYGRSSETLAICMSSCRKRGALLFDRVYHRPTWDQDVPKEMTFFFPEVEHLFKEQQVQFLDLLLSYTNRSEYPPDELLACGNAEVLNMRLAVAAHEQNGICLTPVYESTDKLYSDFPKGKATAYQATINNLPSVVEDNLSWAQVEEFRKDHQAKGHYRALRHWLADLAELDSISEAQDRIEQRLENYNWAVRKHGLQTTVGSLSVLLTSSVVSQLAGTAAAGAVIGGPVWAALSAGALSLTHVALHVAKQAIDLETIKREQYAEIAIVAELVRRT